MATTPYGPTIPDPNKKPKANTSTPPPGYGLTANTVPAPPNPQADAQAWINNPESSQGGMDSYTKTQNDRWQSANASNDYDLMKRLQSDSQRVGYTLNPYNPPASAPNTTAPAQFSDWQAKQNQILQRYEAMMNTPFKYDATTDPNFQAFQTLTKSRAEQAAKDANKATLETMNERGLLNSSLTTSQLSQNENRYRQQAEMEALAAIPQYEANARADYQSRLANAAQLLQFASGQGEASDARAYRDQQAARAVAESDRNFDRGVLESDRSFDRNVAEGDRAYDRGVLESDRAFDAQQSAQEWNQMFQQEQFDWQKAQQIWDNTFKEKSFEQGVKEFAAQQGYNWAQLSQRDKEFVADQAYREQQLELARDDNDRQWAQLDWQMSSGGQQPNYRGMTANQVLSTIRSNYTEPVMDANGFNKVGEQMASDPNRRYQMFLDVIDSNLPSDTETDQVFVGLGLTKKEIDEFSRRAQQEFSGRR